MLIKIKWINLNRNVLIVASDLNSSGFRMAQFWSQWSNMRLSDFVFGDSFRGVLWGNKGLSWGRTRKKKEKTTTTRKKNRKKTLQNYSVQSDTLNVIKILDEVFLPYIETHNDSISANLIALITSSCVFDELNSLKDEFFDEKGEIKSEIERIYTKYEKMF